MTSNTLHLTVPKWLGGNEPAYHFGSRLLGWLAPPHDGPEETIDVPGPDGAPQERGRHYRAYSPSRAGPCDAVTIDAPDPGCIVALGGDCLIDLAPIAYLNEKHDGEFGVLWVDSHPDVMGPEQIARGHAMVLGGLLGEGDPDVTAGVADDSQPILDWIEREDITQLAIHFDLDVLDPEHFSPLVRGSDVRIPTRCRGQRRR